MKNDTGTAISKRDETSSPQTPASVSNGNTTDLQPDPTWSLDDLAGYAKAGFTASDSAESEAKDLADKLAFTARTSILAYFRAGKALTLARDKLKATGEWCGWLDSHSLNRKTVLTAITIFEQGKTEDEVSRYSLAEAKRLWCYDRKKEATATTKKTGAKALAIDPHPGVTSTPVAMIDDVIDRLRKIGIGLTESDQRELIRGRLVALFELVAELQASFEAQPPPTP